MSQKTRLMDGIAVPPKTAAQIEYSREYHRRWRESNEQAVINSRLRSAANTIERFSNIRFERDNTGIPVAVKEA